jgi:hypothetical protein
MTSSKTLTSEMRMLKLRLKTMWESGDSECLRNTSRKVRSSSSIVSSLVRGAEFLA